MEMDVSPMPDLPQTIFLVGTKDVETDDPRHTCASRATAETRYHEIRQELIIAAKQLIARRRQRGRPPGLWAAYLLSLKANDTEAYHDTVAATPYIREIELEA